MGLISPCPWSLAFPYTHFESWEARWRERASQTSNPFILHLKLWLFIINILVTLLHKGQINIRFEVSSLIALGSVPFPWRTNPAPINSQLCFNNTVVQGAKQQGFGKVLLGHLCRHLQPLRFPGGFPPGAPRGVSTPSGLGGSEEDPDGEELVGPVDFEAPDRGVLTQKWIQMNKNMLPGRPRCAQQRNHVIGDLAITASMPIWHASGHPGTSVS